ncbi:hypothetical protein M9M90_09100 [Phenylobacterium sp. LH3H17]|uniref:SMP-30/gluconolactonase/LRE family protein n=1 Tax=Phenylobacterium sp. LH3H17 TaxID=2903901 RepID=UPI0020C9DD0B|nr:hypothetical protein [Phenylobacterium sp. LH3H17]UTP41314.1 hypothetical protein M9M90_09100 [Phenylobacterium sp. LH3H17]
MKGALTALAGLLIAACQGLPAQAAARLEPLWTLDGLEAPESVALSADGSFFYVANVVGEGDAKDGRGFISRVSRDGKLLQKEWATGLNAPKGAVLAHGRLYVTDINRLVGFDLTTGKAVETHEVAGAGFLNDTAVAPDGTLLFSDSGNARIYAKQGKGDVTVWVQAPELRAVNGLLPEKDRLVVTTMAGKLLAVDYRTKAITVLAEGIGDGDGAARLDDGRYLVSEWPGRMFEVAPGGALAVTLDTKAAGRFMNDFIRVGDQLIVPNWMPGSLTAYRIIP